jgi:carboxypeptidase D
MIFLNVFIFYFTAVFALPPKSPIFARDGDRKQFLVSDLPGLVKNINPEDVPLMFAGQIDLYPETETGYFYWKFEDQNKLPQNVNKTTFWLNGGPGCSSMDGALLEAGPFRVNADHKVEYNNGSWHKLSDLVFVDQPAGTGFSYTKNYRHDLDEIASDFMVFLSKYFEIFPETKSHKIYLAGESYAGQYIPYIADAILRSNERNETNYDLQGLLIGNGWISPNEQSLSYVPFAVHAKLIDPIHPSWSVLLDQVQECQKIVSKVDSTFDDGKIHNYEVVSDQCESILSTLLTATNDYNGPQNQQCVNMYDYTLRDKFPACGSNWPNELAYVTPFLNNPEVASNLNLKHTKKWVECSGSVGRKFKAKNSIPAIHLLPSITEKIPVMLFHGNLDIICNYIGAESMIKKLNWGGQIGFSPDLMADDWVYDNKTVGYIKSERNLTFVNVFDASHMVPYDKPEISRALIDLMTRNYDVVDNGDGKSNKAIVTYPIDHKKEVADMEDSHEDESKPSISKPDTESSDTDTDASDSEDSDNETDGTSKENQTSSDSEKSSHSSRITRFVQIVVIGILIWGLYVLYVSYKSNPVSIIKTGSTSGKKKNVQWAEHLRRFQEDDDEFQRQQTSKQGFLSKTLGKITGSSGSNYAPVPNEDIELGEGVGVASQSTPPVDEFQIDSDEETDTKPLPALPEPDKQ